MEPDQSRERARQIAAMPPGNYKHRCFDELINAIAREHGHGEAVDIFEAVAAPDHYEPPPISVLTEDQREWLLQWSNSPETCAVPADAILLLLKPILEKETIT